MNEYWIAYLLVLLLGIGSVVLWIWTMVNAARNGRWVWFVLILLFAVLCLPYLVYLLFAEKRQPEIRQRPSVRLEPTLSNERPSE